MTKCDKRGEGGQFYPMRQLPLLLCIHRKCFLAQIAESVVKLLLSTTKMFYS